MLFRGGGENEGERVLEQVKDGVSEVENGGCSGVRK